MCEEQAAGCEMIGIAEYAKRNGVPRNTVAYWCQKGMLKGVVKQPDAKSGFAKYIYLIPKDAEPQKQTAANIAKKQGMLTASEYARRMGCSKKTVANWCWKGLIPGAVKAEKGEGFYFWMIPEGAKVTKPYHPPKARHRKAPEEPAAEKPKPKRPATERGINLHIRRFCGTHTYRQLAEDLGMSTEEVRRRYERLHRLYGV